MHARRLRILAAALVVVLVASRAWAQGTAPAIPRVIIDDGLQGRSMAAATAAALGDGRPVRFGARLALDSLAADARSALAARVGELAARKVPIWLAVPAPPSSDASAEWRAQLLAVLAAHGTSLDVVEVTFERHDEQIERFALEVAAANGRATRPGLVIAASSRDPEAERALTRAALAELAPSLDLLLVDQGQMARALTEIEGSPLRLVSRAEGTLTDGMAGRQAMVADVLATVATPVAGRVWRATSPEVAAAGLRALAPIGPLLAHDVTQLQPDAVALAVTNERGDIPAGLAARVVFDQETFTSYLIYSSPDGPPLRVRLRLPVEAVPQVRDLAAGTAQPARPYQRDPDSGMIEATVPSGPGVRLVDFNDGAADVVGDRTGVAARRALTVEEIIARHREQQAAQDLLLASYSAAARMEQHFRPSLTDPGYDVVTENRYFVEGTTVEWEELSFSVNGSKWGADRPAFPMLQPEKVLSQPLDLRLGSDYTYRLQGRDRVDGTDCYVVGFAPTRDDQALYKGTVWIDQRTFAKVRVDAVQTRTSAPIISNDEVHRYTTVPLPGGRSVTLLSRLTAKQIVLIAGRNLLLEKAITFEDVRVNDPAFAARRDEARRGERIMYRDTDQGVRYLVKEGEGRVVSERATTRARAAAIGLLLDPSYAFPLPIVGLNLLDFQFRGDPDTQLAILFAGVLAAGNIQRPRLGRTPFDASLDFFAIAAPSTDRLFGQGGERKAERVLTWPLTTGLNVGWQYSPFQKVIGHYQFRFDPFVRDRPTAEAFVVPSSTVTNGVGVTWEYRRGGYSLTANGTWYARASWDAWGLPETNTDPPRPRYAKFALHLSKDIFLDAFNKVHLNGSYFSSRQLDRFSRYQFGLFDDTRIHGVPSSGVRFDDVAMARGSYSFNLFEQYRLDLFLDQAWGRDRTVDDTWQPITGIGAAINFRAPYNTILRADVGKSILPTRYRDVGSTVVQVMILKPLR